MTTLPFRQVLVAVATTTAAAVLSPPVLVASITRHKRRWMPGMRPRHSSTTTIITTDWLCIITTRRPLAMAQATERMATGLWPCPAAAVARRRSAGRRRSWGNGSCRDSPPAPVHPRPVPPPPPPMMSRRLKWKRIPNQINRSNHSNNNNRCQHQQQ